MDVMNLLYSGISDHESAVGTELPLITAIVVIGMYVNAIMSTMLLHFV